MHVAMRLALAIALQFKFKLRVCTRAECTANAREIKYLILKELLLVQEV